MKFKSIAAVLALVFMLPFASQHVFASDRDDIVATVHRFADNLDPKTIDKALATCDSTTSIIDEFPPHAWNSCQDWIKDFGEFNEKNGVTEADAKIGGPWSVDVDGDRAYVVAPATNTYKQRGKVMKEAHAVFTAALRRTDAGWRFSAWSWARHWVPANGGADPYGSVLGLLVSCSTLGVKCGPSRRTQNHNDDDHSVPAGMAVDAVGGPDFSVAETE